MSEALYCCPQCGGPAPALVEGYCEPCWRDRQIALDRHNAEHDRWNSLSDEERRGEIRRSII